MTRSRRPAAAALQAHSGGDGVQRAGGLPLLPSGLFLTQHSSTGQGDVRTPARRAL